MSGRIRSISESPTMVVAARARELRAAGEDIIDLGLGEPDFPTPGHIVQAAQAACGDVRNHRYSAAVGLPELREAIAWKTRHDSQYDVDPSQVVISNGAKHSLFNVFLSILDPGDEVLLPTPYWVSYPEQIRLAGGVAVKLPTDETSGFQVTVDQLERAVSRRTKALVFVSPSNPTGAVYDPAAVEELGRWALARGIWVVADEIYEQLVYGDVEYRSMPSVVPGLASRCVVTNGVAKAYAMTGWRVGWSIAPPNVAAGIGRLQSQTTSNVANVSQRAALAALTGPQDVVENMRAKFDKRRRLAYRALSAIPGVDIQEPRGAFYAFPNFNALLGTRVAGVSINSTLDLASMLLNKVGVAIVPGEAFGAPGYARLSYALSDNDLQEGLERVAVTLTSD